VSEQLPKERAREQIRQALAEIEEQRDDAVVYLSAIKLVLDVLARGHPTRQSGQEIADALLTELTIETCVVALREGGDRQLTLAGFASQSQRLGGPRSALDEAGWLALGQLAKPGVQPTCFHRLPDGSFASVSVAALEGEGFLLLPFAVGGEAGGVLILHSLVAPAQVFARGRALALVAEIVGQALTMARMRESVEHLCDDLESELGITRRALSDHEASLRSQEENIQHLTQSLIRSNRVKRDFLGTVSHELRTPLNAILGYTSLLRDGMAGTLTDEQTSLLDRVLTNSQSLNGLIDDILFFVQLESDRVLIRPQRVVTADLIANVMSSVPEPPGREVAFRVDVGPEATVLAVDASLLRRLLFHLLGNAFKFTVHGEVCVSVRGGDEAGSVVIVVRDTGVGIPPERIDSVFELFHQGDSSTTRRYDGLGIGLTLVQRCVRLLGGEVTVESRPQEGSEFRVYLPRILPRSTASAAEVPSQPLGTVH
jgi:signal transduction histidine kinase